MPRRLAGAGGVTPRNDDTAIALEGTTFGDVPLNIELKLEVWDSPNSVGVVIDAIRCAKLALNHKIGGTLFGPSAYFMKSPRQQYTDDEARRMTEDYIRAHALPQDHEAPSFATATAPGAVQ